LYLAHEVGALVLVDPLGDLFGFNLSGICQRLGISDVWKSEVQVMGGVLNVKWSRLWAYFKGNATGLPGIELSIGENDVGRLHKVFLGVLATEVFESPAILGAEAISGFTVGGVFDITPLC
jgi:hypothetical protein